MGAPVVHWEINARDGRRLQDFYSTLFGWNVDANNPMNYGLVNTGSKSGINGGVAQMDPNMPGPAVTFYVEVADLQAYLDKAQSLGGTMIVPPTEIPNMVTFAMFSDPEGNKIGLVKAMAPPPKQRKPRAKKATARKKKATKRKGGKAKRRR